MQRWTKPVGLAAAALMAVTACGSSATPSQTGSTPYPVKIMVGGLSKQIYLPNMLTQQLGYFKEQNLDVTLVDEQSAKSKRGTGAQCWRYDALRLVGTASHGEAQGVLERGLKVSTRALALLNVNESSARAVAGRVER